MTELYINGKSIELTSKGNPYEMNMDEAIQMYEANGIKSFQIFKGYEFPYPVLDKKKAISELKSLRGKQNSDNTKSHIIASMHKSRYACSRYDMMSPLKYWEFFKKDENLPEWKKFYINRLRNANTRAADQFREDGIMRPETILQGFTITHRADCPGYLKPTLAKRLIHKYLDQFNEVFCPFNGFSGIMLGATVGNQKKFIGRDINQHFIEESQQIADLVKNDFDSAIDIDLNVKDMFEGSGEYQCLIACPPYFHQKHGNIEKWNFDESGRNIDKDLTCDQWIDECLARYRCKKYLFIVDDKNIDKHRGNIVETLKNRSHFGSNCEHVVLF